VRLHTNWKAHFIVKGEGLLKVTGSHMYLKNGNTLETVSDRDVATTGT